MNSPFEKLIAHTWNRLATPAPQRTSGENLDLGAQIVDDRATGRRVTIPQAKRPEHLAILGKTGQGKSFFLRHLAGQDVRSGRGFFFFDLHGDTMPFLLKVIAEEEIHRRADLSAKLIVIEPADPEFSIGLNLLEHRPGEQMFVQIAEFAEILKSRWHLDHLGARTEELLRNSLHLLADNNFTLMELTALLTNETFRAVCLRQASNPDIADYFRSRFDQQSEAMQAVYRDAILNKVSGFTADPRFRHILVLAALPDYLRRIIICALDTGMRRGEVLRQRWEDVDLARKLLMVTKSKTIEGEGREIPLTDRLYRLLSKEAATEGIVFTMRGQPLSWIRKGWLGALKRAELRHFRIHDLRHTFNTRLMEAGVIQDVRMALMGHSGGSRVHSTYTHVEFPVKREAIARLQKWVSKQRKEPQGGSEHASTESARPDAGQDDNTGRPSGDRTETMEEKNTRGSGVRAGRKTQGGNRRGGGGPETEAASA